jgi:tetratricopeptide (TPR) repeat protein
VAALAEAERTEGGPEPDLLVELGDLYFEADGEVEHSESRNRSPAPLYDQALKLDPKHEGAQVSLYQLYRFNWMRQRRSAFDILNELLRVNPRSIAGLVAGASADFDDGQLVAVREKLATLEKLAPARRDVRALRAALAWIENQDEHAGDRLAALIAEDPQDGEPERELGRHLCELYRFAEALPFLERATQRDPGDWLAWTQLGRAQANTGRESEALASLKKSTELAAGRADAWRHNMTRVLEKLAREFQDERFGELSFSWSPAAADVFRAYWVPFYPRSAPTSPRATATRRDRRTSRSSRAGAISRCARPASRATPRSASASGRSSPRSRRSRRCAERSRGRARRSTNSRT